MIDYFDTLMSALIGRKLVDRVFYDEYRDHTSNIIAVLKAQRDGEKARADRYDAILRDIQAKALCRDAD